MTAKNARPGVHHGVVFHGVVVHGSRDSITNLRRVQRKALLFAVYIALVAGVTTMPPFSFGAEGQQCHP